MADSSSDALSSSGSSSGTSGSSDWGTPVSGGPTASGTAATVTVMHGSTQGHLPNNFIGFSFEKTNLSNGYFTGSNAPLIALFRLLGPSVVRIGGNDVDVARWVASAPATSGFSTSTSIGTADVDAFDAFLQAAGWSAIYGINLETATSSEVVAEATYVTNKLGSKLFSIEIGNEIEAFSSITPTAAVSKWDTFAKAIHAAIPAAKLAGPADFKAASFATSFAATEAKELALLTHHHYIAAGTSSNATVSNMLTDTSSVDMTAGLVQAAKSNNLSQGYRWGESNSYSHHGASGVSDVFASALYGIDLMLGTAQKGALGVHFHGGGQNMDGNTCSSGVSSCSNPFRYSPIIEVGSAVSAAAPLYYGMLLVAHAGTGDMVSTSSSLGNGKLSAYTIVQSDGSTNVVLSNKQSSAVTVSLDMGSAVTSASAKYLLGSSLTSSTGGTFAGSAVSATGAWTPTAPFSLTSKGNVVTVPMPGASAVIVHVK